MPWSYSRITSYEKCPYTLKLAELKLPQETNEHAQRGIDTHATIEQFLKGESKTAPHFEGFTIELLDLYAQTAQSETKWQVGKDWQPRSQGCSDIWGKAIIDAAVLEKTNLRIIDFKTGKPSPVSHMDQGNIYAVMGHAWFPDCETYTTEFWYLDKQIKKTHVYTADSLTPIRINLEKRIQRMENDTVLAPRPSKWTCKWCKYKAHCEYSQSD